MKLRDLNRGDVFRIKNDNTTSTEYIYVLLDKHTDDKYSSVRELIIDSTLPCKHYRCNNDEIPTSFNDKTRKYMYKYKGWNYILYEIGHFLDMNTEIILISGKYKKINSVINTLLK